MATNYARGAARERAIANLHKSAGWSAVRSAGSHGTFDVLAYGRAWKAIQAKSTPSDAHRAMRDIALGELVPGGTLVEVWLKLPTGWRVWRMVPGTMAGP
jgi:hypothetical protein